MRTLPSALAATALLTAALPALAAEPFFAITDLGIANVEGARINNLGHVLVRTDGVTRSFLWRDGVRTDMPSDFQGYDLNELDEIVGGSGHRFSSFQAAMWIDGVVTLLGQYHGLPTHLSTINNNGRMAGENSIREGFWLERGETVLSDLVPFWLAASPVSMNDSGMIIGYNKADVPTPARGFKWDEGFAYELAAFPSSRESFASDVNNAGVIVGASVHRGSNRTEAVIFDGTTALIELGELAELKDSWAYGINESGQIVGFGKIDLPADSERAALWQDGQIYNLNDLVSGGEWTFFVAYDINDAGQIVGVGELGEKSHVFLLTPTDPPPCIPDLNGDGEVDFSDYLEFLNLFDTQDPRVDFNHDGFVDFLDYLEFLNLYGAGC